MLDLSFYKGRKVFITGDTGFKGTWLSKILCKSGAVVTGYSIGIPTDPSLNNISGIEKEMHSVVGDIRNYEYLKKVFDKSEPEIVFHMAAQPIVREGYNNPVYTYETNVMGTLNILECIRNSSCVKSFVNVTTDKVYLNNEWEWGYRESDELNGADPYSNSKSCSELITSSYRKSFFTDKFGKITIPISTVRAGNVIGGGDFADNRIIPDCVRAAINHKSIVVRNPFSIRPYQHVLEALYAYLMIAAEQYKDVRYSGCYNVGPDDNGCVQTGKLVELFVNEWGQNLSWKNVNNNGPHEANFLKLDCSKLKHTFGWSPKWNIEKAVEETVKWSKCWLSGDDMGKYMNNIIDDYFGGCKDA